jgi:hypothetical protein
MRRNKRDLKRELDELKGNATGDFPVETEFVEITEEMVDSRGNVIDERLPAGYSTGENEYILETECSEE